MKKTIKFNAILFLTSICTAVTAGAQAKMISPIPGAKNVINFSLLPSEAGINLTVEKNEPGKVVIIISDEYANVLLKQVLQTGKTLEKDYILYKLDNGDYTVDVTSGKKDVKKEIRIYDGQCSILRP